MYAIEFSTKIKNGIIEIPKEYRNKLKDKDNVKVILLSEEEQEITSDIIERLMDSPLKVENFTPLTREEIYERR
jgi:bifunctional DNA-binding transcriptional regulator/antitoxin component of YhaV-PrlF toxin-antitoxin module